jgi:hypothetical protein
VPIPCLKKTNTAIGGGLFSGDTTLFATVDQATRTFILAQLARDFTQKGYPVVTEQSMENIDQTPQIIIFDLGPQMDLEHSQVMVEWINYARRTDSIVILGSQLDRIQVKGRQTYIHDTQIENYLEVQLAISYLTNFIGVTALRENGEILRVQNMCISKATRGPGGVVKVEMVRNLQRFVEYVPRLQGGG